MPHQCPAPAQAGGLGAARGGTVGSFQMIQTQLARTLALGASFILQGWGAGPTMS